MPEGDPTDYLGAGKFIVASGWRPHTVLGELENGTTTLENCWQLLIKVKRDWAIPLLRCLLKKNEHFGPHADLSDDVYNDFMHNGPKVETQGDWVTVLYLHALEHYSAKKSNELLALR